MVYFVARTIFTPSEVHCEVFVFSEVFVNPETGRVYKEGDIYHCLALADTLERIASDPEDFYSGETARMLIHDFTALGGQMSLEDLESYTCVLRKAVVLVRVVDLHV